MDPILLILLCASVAAAAAALGVLPLRSPGTAPEAWLGWANALASGLMFGGAIVIAQAGLDHPPAPGALGALAGILLVYGTHALSNIPDVDLHRIHDAGADYGYKVLFLAILHASLEGIAIGVAMWTSVPLGIAVAITMTIHNVPEGMVLGAVLRESGVATAATARMAVTANLGQVFLGISTYAVIEVAPGIFPAVNGFAVGALVFLVLSDLLPQAYAQAGRTAIAVVASAAMGMVLLLGGVIR